MESFSMKIASLEILIYLPAGDHVTLVDRIRALAVHYHRRDFFARCIGDDGGKFELVGGHRGCIRHWGRFFG